MYRKEFCHNKGFLIVLSGPSGAGKGTVISKLLQNENYSLSISATTRAPRQNEQDGIHYFFKTKDEFKNMIKQKKLLEYAEFCDNFYGTPLDYVEEQLQKSKNVILEIEVQGALQVKKLYPQAILIFLIPENISELEKRLVNRKTEDLQTINKRIETAKKEIKLLNEYNYVVINDSVEQAVDDINKIIYVENLKTLKSDNIIKNFLKEI